MQKRCISGLLLVLSFSILCAAQHNNSCNTFTIVGTYAVSCSGEIMTAQGEVPFQVIGEAVIDYSGYVRSAKACNNIGGQVSYGGVEGQSTVAPDCTTDVRYYPIGYKQIPGFGKDNWLFYIRANILDNGEEMQGFILAMQDPATATPLSTPAVSCKLTRKSRSVPAVIPDPNWCTVPPVQ